MRKPWVIAHRGASGHAPENTMAAFRGAVELGAQFVETDLHLSRDKQLVVIHDPTLERTTNGKGRVCEHSLAELHRLDAGWWFDRNFKDERIPTLQDLLAFGRPAKLHLYLEAKYPNAFGAHQPLVRALHQEKYLDRATVLCFDTATLEAIHRTDPAVAMGLLIEERRPDPVALAVKLGAKLLCPRGDIVMRELVDKAHEAGLYVSTWTIDRPEEMRELIAMGVDGIMTDFPDRLRGVIEDSPLGRS